MFKNKRKLSEFIKRQTARVLAVVMAFTSFASSGLALTTVFGAEEPKNDYAQSFVDAAVDITDNGTKYIWGGWLNPGVDCRGLVRASLRNAYGLDIQNTAGYWVDEDGNAVLDKSGNRQYVDIAQHGKWILPGFKAWAGRRICVESSDGKLVTYYNVLVADYTGNVDGAADIKMNGSTYSSIIAYACQFPGAIICHNGHYGLGLGAFNSEEEFLKAYPTLDMQCSGDGATSSDRVTRWSQTAYDIGNTYDKDEYGYWFGKTVFLSACSPKSGIRADNFTTTGKSSNPTDDSELVILIPEVEPKTADIIFTKYDSASISRGENIQIAGATYQIYTDPLCTKPVDGGKFVTDTKPVTISLPKGVYYVKESNPPEGYQLSNEVTKIDTTNVSSLSVTLYDNPVNSTIMIQKVDSVDKSISLNLTEFTLYEYSDQAAKAGDANPYKEICKLSYSDETKSFVVPASYTNVLGETYTDGSLHYTTDNLGQFRVRETKAQDGYVNANFSKDFNITKGSLRLTGQNAITNDPLFSFTINKTNLVGDKKLNGAKFRFNYNGVDYNLTTGVANAVRIEDANGIITITGGDGSVTIAGLPATATMAGTLYEILAPTDENGTQYIPLLNLVTGQMVALKHEKVSSTTDCYHTEMTFKNNTAPIPAATSGRIVFTKYNHSNPLLGGVKDAKYSVYTNIECTEFATTLDGIVLNGLTQNFLKTDSNGQIKIDNLALGTYYIKEVEAPYGFAISPKVFTINLIDDGSADANGVINGTIAGNSVGDPRQTVTLDITKVDSITGIGVPNAVYELRNTTPITTAIWNKTIPAGTLLGYYKTDANGKLHITYIGAMPADRDIIADDGTVYSPVHLMADDGISLDGEPLPNGVYQLKEVDAPYGYALNAALSIDALYKGVVDGTTTNNNCTYEISWNGRFMNVSATIEDARQTVNIVLSKDDVQFGNNTNAHYGLNTYDQAVSNGLAATLVGAKYQLVNTTDIVDVKTGATIPAGTVLGVYTIDDDLTITINTMNRAPYDGAIPNGIYELREFVSPGGYALNGESIRIDATWNNQTSFVLNFEETHHEQILSQAVTINKFDDEGNAMEGVAFKLYNVAEIYDAIYAKDGTYPTNSIFEKTDSIGLNGLALIDRNSFEELIGEYNVAASKDANGNSTFSTNANGILNTGKFVYGDYIIYEVSAPIGHIASDCMYVQLPWQEIDVSGSAGDDNAEDSIITFYAHDMDFNPSTSLNVDIYNIQTRVDFAVEKVWKDFNDKYEERPDSVVVELCINGTKTGNTVTLSETNNWQWTWKSLLEYDANGQKITYTAVEVGDCTNYDAPVYVHDANKTTITNNYHPLIDFTIFKTWKDGNDSLGMRTEYIEAQLTANDVNVGNTIKLDKTNNWTVTISNLDKLDAHGEIIKYKAREITVLNDHRTTYIETDTSCEIINEPLTSFTVIKQWKDRGNFLGLRPTAVQVELFADGTKVDEITLSPFNNWTYTWDGLSVFDIHEHQIHYTVKEKDVPNGYDVSVENGLIVNTSTVTSVFIEKLVDDNGQDKFLAGAKMQLLDSNGNIAMDINGNKCEWTTDGTAKHIVGLKPGTYILKEIDAPSGYATAKDVTVIVNNTIDDQTFTMYNKQTSITIDKVSANNNTLFVVGAKLQLLDNAKNPLLDEDGEPIIWTTDGKSKTFVGLEPGVYYIQELSAPVGYYKLNKMVPMIVEDSEKLQKFVLRNEQVMGTIDVIKRDGETLDALNNVEFKLISVNKVVDPLTNKVIYDKGEVIETLVTNINGIATLSKNIPIMTYGQNGVVTPIVYKIIETKPANGAQYDASSVFEEFVFQYGGDDVDLIHQTFEFTNNKPIISVEKTGTPDTFIGKYENKFGVTVVENGADITYTIKVRNDGLSDAWNIVIKDKIPENTVYKTAESVHGATYDSATNTIYWTIDRLAGKNSGQNIIELKFTVSVTSNKASEIVNTAYWAMPDKVPTTPEELLDPKTNDKWNETNAVVHQTVEFHKTSTVLGGNTRNDAVAVSPGDTIKYTLTFTAVDDVRHLVIEDKIPVGLTFVDGSAMENGVPVNATYDPTTRMLAFPGQDLFNTTVKFEFDVTVDEIDLGSRVYYDNVAFATYNIGSKLGDTITIESDHITHYAESKIKVEKHGAPTTFEGNKGVAKDITVVMKGETIKYQIIVTNTGDSDVHNIVIKDAVPNGTAIIENSLTDNNCWITADGEITWLVENIPCGDSETITFEVSVIEQKAQLVINSASYGELNKSDGEIPGIKRPVTTNDVVHQVVEFHKSSVVGGGVNKNDAVVVNVGDKISYILEVVNPGDIFDIRIEDEIPDGLTYVNGTLCFKHLNDVDWTKLPDGNIIVDANKEIVTIENMDLKAGKTYFKFDVIVDHIGIGNTIHYINQAKLTFDKFANDNNDEPDREELTSETVSHMTNVDATGVKTGIVETFVGNYKDKNHVTVVCDGDTLTYKISVKNTGLSDIATLIIKDKIPNNVKLLQIHDNGQFNEITREVTWVVNDIKSGDTVDVCVDVLVNVDGKAMEIVNKAQYAIPQDPANIQEYEWNDTDCVVHQTLNVVKDSSIEHGKAEEDAIEVKIGDVFQYTVALNSTNTIYGIQFTDKIPTGLTFVEGTAWYKINEQEKVVVKDAKLDVETNRIVFPTIASVENGTIVFGFDVSVDDVVKYDTKYYYINTACITVDTNENSESKVMLETNPVSHVTIKPAPIPDPEPEEPPKTGDNSFVMVRICAITAVLSAVGAVTLGIYGFGKKNKKKKR